MDTPLSTGSWSHHHRKFRMKYEFKICIYSVDVPYLLARKYSFSSSSSSSIPITKNNNRSQTLKLRTLPTFASCRTNNINSSPQSYHFKLLFKMIVKAVFATALFAALATASPSARNQEVGGRSIHKRWEDGTDCTSDTVATQGQAGLFFAINSDGLTYNCDDVDEAAEANGDACYVTNDNPDDLGDRAKCPQDPPPAKNPDGTDAIPADIMKTYCWNSGGPAWLNIPACFVFGFYAAQGDPIAEAESGAVGLCNVIFAGMCNWFMGVAPILAEGMSLPCHDDPGSNACAFANPGKYICTASM